MEAEKYHRSVSQIVLRWIIQRGVVVVTRSSQREHIQENFNVFDFALSDEDMKTMASLNTETSVYFGKLDHYDPATVQSLGSMKFDT